MLHAFYICIYQFIFMCFKQPHLSPKIGKSDVHIVPMSNRAKEFTLEHKA